MNRYLPHLVISTLNFNRLLHFLLYHHHLSILRTSSLLTVFNLFNCSFSIVFIIIILHLSSLRLFVCWSLWFVFGKKQVCVSVDWERAWLQTDHDCFLSISVYIANLRVHPAQLKNIQTRHILTEIQFLSKILTSLSFCFLWDSDPVFRTVWYCSVYRYIGMSILLIISSPETAAFRVLKFR